MVELPENYEQPTVDLIYKKYVEENGDFKRDHLGASVIGQECERKLWYGFRWASDPNFDGRLLRLFQTGFSQEARLLNDLKKIGLAVHTVDPDTGKQIHYSDLGGHFAGSLDAIAQGFVEAPKAFHVVECKTMNTKTFNQLKKKGVKEVKPEHHSQMQTYMGWSGIDRAFYLVVCKENDELYSERIHFDQAAFDALTLKAARIIFSDSPPLRIADSVDNFKCRFCEHKWSCHDTKLPEISCRSCAFSDVVEEGGWRCGRFNKELSPLDQRKACDHHIFNPAMVPLEQVDASDEDGTITYAGGIVNGYGAILSRDLQELIK